MSTSPFDWSGAHAVFVPEIDEEHQELFRLTGQLYAAIGRSVAKPELLTMCSELARSMKRHFAHEDSLMRESYFGSTDWHNRQHEAALSKLANLRKRVRAGDAEGAQCALHFIAAWLRDHTTVADRILASHVRNAQRMRTVAAS